MGEVVVLGHGERVLEQGGAVLPVPELDARQDPCGDEDGRRSERTGEPVHPKSTQHLRHPQVTMRKMPMDGRYA